MDIKENENLASYTTFKIGGPARYFCEPESVEEIDEAMDFAAEKELSVFVLGGGSNVIISDEGFPGFVIHPVLRGITIAQEDNDNVWLTVAAGENWDTIVKMSVENGWWGIENLSHIPGSAGAVAVQNVGAYGQEASQTVENVVVYDMQTRATVSINHSKCDFSYRKSVFNSTDKGRYIILSTTFRLSKVPQPNLTYRDLAQRFENENPTLRDLREAVIEIRNKKFPFPTQAVNGNAGSFFKNPIVSLEKFVEVREKIRSEFGDEVATRLESKSFSAPDAVKIPAAFLIDICGLKDMQVGGAAINASQPLVILNKTGTATAQDVLALADEIKNTVNEKTGILLHQEPELVGF